MRIPFEVEADLLTLDLPPTSSPKHNRARKPGSIGACSYPAKVFKGMRMGGQMGGDRVTTHNLQVLKVIPEHNLLLIKGSVPLSSESLQMITLSIWM